ncbi:trypsin-1-like [Drosophila navojoa]|nr:trypsin-1-like [Drosophila navojoa]
MRPSQLRIFAGTSRRLFRSDDTQELLVKKLITHPKFSHSSLTNDVAVITLKTKVKIDGITADVIPIPNKEPTIGAKCTVIGWGTVIQFGPTPDEVLNADVYIQPYAICKQDTLFTKGMLCAADINDYEVDSCQGDSGGPLICDGFVTGIVSFGIGCGERGSYGVYSDVYYYRNWINNNRATQQKLNGLPAFALAIAIALRAFRIQYF